MFEYQELLENELMKYEDFDELNIYKKRKCIHFCWIFFYIIDFRSFIFRDKMNEPYSQMERT